MKGAKQLRRDARRILEGEFRLAVSVTAVGILASGGSGFRIALLRRALPRARTLAAAVFLIAPGPLLSLYALLLVDRARGVGRDRAGVTAAWACYVQSAVMGVLGVLALYRGEPVGTWGAVLLLLGSSAWAYAGYVMGKRKQSLSEVGELAVRHPALAVRFGLRGRRRSWPEIGPENILPLQRAFEAALGALGDLPAETSLAPDRQFALVLAGRRLGDESRSSPAPFRANLLVRIVLAFLTLPPDRRAELRREWVAFLATHPDAARFRKAVQDGTASLLQEHWKASEDATTTV